jgi:hypothetical protein
MEGRWAHSFAPCPHDVSTHFLPSRSHVCLLVGTAVAQYSPRFGPLLLDLTQLCAAHQWIRVALNVFDNVSHMALRHPHPSIAVSHVQAFKTGFWQAIVTPALLQQFAFTHVFLVLCKGASNGPAEPSRTKQNGLRLPNLNHRLTLTSTLHPTSVALIS